MSEVVDIKKNEGFSITVDDGRIPVAINNSNGEKIGVFYFNPTDIGIVERFKAVSDKFDYVVEPLNELKDDASEDEQIAALKKAEVRLYDLCNNLFGGNFAEAFFGSINPFTPIDGKFYCENALNAVSDFVSKQFDKETAKINARVSKYTADYQKKSGKHKDGRR
jgi:hypothetical protein